MIWAHISVASNSRKHYFGEMRSPFLSTSPEAASDDDIEQNGNISVTFYIFVEGCWKLSDLTAAVRQSPNFPGGSIFHFSLCFKLNATNLEQRWSAAWREMDGICGWNDKEATRRVIASCLKRGENELVMFPLLPIGAGADKHWCHLTQE